MMHPTVGLPVMYNMCVRRLGAEDQTYHQCPIQFVPVVVHTHAASMGIDRTFYTSSSLASERYHIIPACCFNRTEGPG